MLSLIILPAILVGQQVDRHVDSLFRARFPPGEPGAAVSVVQDGVVRHLQAYGLADVELKVPLTTATPFYIASVAKPFTALAIHMLAGRGQLAYDDRLTRWIPELTGADSAITISHLLTHSAGLADFYSFIDWPKFRTLDNQGVLDTTRAHPVSRFPPGSRYEYSNTGYVLLSIIAERAGRRSLGTQLAERVFQPLGMRDAIIYNDTAIRLNHRAKAYGRSGERFLLSDIDALELPDGRVIRFTFLQTGQGGMLASASDMAAFLKGILSSELVDSAGKATLFSPRLAATGQAGIPIVESVAFGWFVSRRNGREIVWHDGSRGGSRAIVALVRGSRLGVAVLANVAHADPLDLALKILDRHIPP